MMAGVAVDSKHCANLLRTLDDQRRRGAFCDLTVIVADHKFLAHRNVLAGASARFRQLLGSGGDKGYGAVGRVVELPSLRPEVFAEVLNFVYSASANVLRLDLRTELVHAGKELGISFLANLPLDDISLKIQNKDDSIQDEVALPPAVPLDERIIKHEKDDCFERVEDRTGVNVPRTTSASESNPMLNKAAPCQLLSTDHQTQNDKQFYDSSSINSKNHLPSAVTPDVPTESCVPHETVGGEASNKISPAYIFLALEHSYFVQTPEMRSAVAHYWLHRFSQRSAFQCNFCEDVFDNEAAFKDHEVSHREVLVQCDRCHLPFMSQYLLNVHPCEAENLQVTPTGAKCSTPRPSPASVSQVEPIQTEMQIQPAEEMVKQEEETFPIPEPESLMLTIDGVTSQQLPTNTVVPERPKSQNRIQRVLSSQDEHYVRMNAGQMLYCCTVCHRSYVQLTSLKRHANVHSWRKKYPCHYCNRVFALAEYRTKHEVWHTDERRYQCIFCAEAFLTYHFLRTHQRTAHGITPAKGSPSGPVVRLYRLLPRQINRRFYRLSPHENPVIPSLLTDTTGEPPRLIDPHLNLDEHHNGEGASCLPNGAMEWSNAMEVTTSFDDKIEMSDIRDRPPSKRVRKQKLLPNGEKDDDYYGESDDDAHDYHIDANGRSYYGKPTYPFSLHDGGDVDSDPEWRDGNWRPYNSYKSKRRGFKAARGRGQCGSWQRNVNDTQFSQLHSTAVSSPTTDVLLSAFTDAATASLSAIPGNMLHTSESNISGLPPNPFLEFQSTGGIINQDLIIPDGLEGGNVGEASARVSAVLNNAQSSDVLTNAEHENLYPIALEAERMAKDFAIAEKLLQMGKVQADGGSSHGSSQTKDTNMLLDLSFSKGSKLISNFGKEITGPMVTCVNSLIPEPNQHCSSAFQGHVNKQGLDLSTGVFKEPCSHNGAADLLFADANSELAQLKDLPTLNNSSFHLNDSPGLYHCPHCDMVFPLHNHWLQHQFVCHKERLDEVEALVGRELSLSGKLQHSALDEMNCDDKCMQNEAPGEVKGLTSVKDNVFAGSEGGDKSDKERNHCPLILSTEALCSDHHLWHHSQLNDRQQKLKFKGSPNCDLVSKPEAVQSSEQQCPDDTFAEIEANASQMQANGIPDSSPSSPLPQADLPFACSLCKHCFAHAEELACHYGWHWVDGYADKLSGFKCFFCPRVLKTNAARMQHQRCHRSDATEPSSSLTVTLPQAS